MIAIRIIMVIATTRIIVVVVRIIVVVVRIVVMVVSIVVMVVVRITAVVVAGIINVRVVKVIKDVFMRSSC